LQGAGRGGEDGVDGSLYETGTVGMESPGVRVDVWECTGFADPRRKFCKQLGVVVGPIFVIGSKADLWVF